jgi:hypothetical protein
LRIIFYFTIALAKSGDDGEVIVKECSRSPLQPKRNPMSIQALNSDLNASRDCTQRASYPSIYSGKIHTIVKLNIFEFLRYLN